MLHVVEAAIDVVSLRRCGAIYKFRAIRGDARRETAVADDIIMTSISVDFHVGCAMVESLCASRPADETTGIAVSSCQFAGGRTVDELRGTQRHASRTAFTDEVVGTGAFRSAGVEIPVDGYRSRAASEDRAVGIAHETATAAVGQSAGAGTGAFAHRAVERAVRELAVHSHADETAHSPFTADSACE